MRAQRAGSRVPLSIPYPLLIVRHFRNQCVLGFLCWGSWPVSWAGPICGPAAECSFSSEPHLVSAWPQRPGCRVKALSLEGTMKPSTGGSCSGEPRLAAPSEHLAESPGLPHHAACPGSRLGPLPSIWTPSDLSDQARDPSRPGLLPQRAPPLSGPPPQGHRGCQFLLQLGPVAAFPLPPKLLEDMGHVSLFWGLCPLRVRSGL